MEPPPTSVERADRTWLHQPCDRTGRGYRAENDRDIGLRPLLCGCAEHGGWFVPWWITRWEFRPPFFDLDATRAVGILLIVAGLPGLVNSFGRFALQGLGTPAPIAPTQNLVVTGLYRYVRNPIYVALLGRSS